VCGNENPKGLDAQPFLENNQVKIEFCPQDAHMGFKDVVHGGILAALLDEASYWAATLATRSVCVTADMSVRYQKPLPVHLPTVTYAHLVERRGRRRIIIESCTRDAEGQEYARATSTFMTVPGDLAEAFSDDPSIAQVDFAAYPIEPFDASGVSP
jgi:uncharacterized protein (TIGR00369 family)